MQDLGQRCMQWGALNALGVATRVQASTLMCGSLHQGCWMAVLCGVCQLIARLDMHAVAVHIAWYVIV